MKINQLYVYALLFVLLLGACKQTPEEQYLSLEAEELATKVRYDKLFKGLYLGMKDSTFFDFCLKKNIHKDFFQGGQKNSAWITTKIKSPNHKTLEINFFPTFKVQKIAEVNAAFYYQDAVAWKVGASNDKLLSDVIQLLESWYQRKFIKINSPYFFKNDVFVTVRGNCRIVVSEEAQSNVINVRFIDLLAPKQ